MPERGLLDQLTAVPLVFPGIVLGVAVLRLFLGLPGVLFGTLVALVFAQLIRLIPYSARYSQAGLIQVHGELEEVAHVSGASWWVTARRVVLPLMMPALLAGWLFAFMASMRDLATVLMLYGQESWVISIVVFNMYSDSRFGQLSALCVIWLVCLIPAMAAFHHVSRRYGLQPA